MFVLALRIGPKWVVSNATWAPGKQALWIHLLNVSAFYPGGDTGFRGMGQKAVYVSDTASDGALPIGQSVSRVNRPAKNIRVAAPGFQVMRAYLGVGGQNISQAADGSYIVPELETHEVLVLELN